ncbi:MAG TPA: DUF1415 family protein [Myxococcales bacterium]|nr:DUF1415 family protein [Myxococcales bacterium]
MDAAAALARNDRYIREFVEALRICPYAKTCRESGKLQRRVLESLQQAPSVMAEIEAMPEDSVEVALLIFPGAPAGSERAARDFENFCAGLRPGLEAFYCVAFHPDLPRDLADGHRAVQFIRRSPDPTIQMVRASVLRAVRGPDDGGTRVLTGAHELSLEQLLAIATPLSLADRIAQANLETLQREGPDRIEALLSSFRARAAGTS